jgi:hypothetical protein
VASCDVNLHRGFADGELERGLQRGVELLSAGKVSLRWRGSVQAKGFARGRSVPIYTETAGVRCARSGEEKERAAAADWVRWAACNVSAWRCRRLDASVRRPRPG